VVMVRWSRTARRRRAARLALPAIVVLGVLAFLVPTLPAVAVPASSSLTTSSGWTARRLPLPLGGLTNTFMLQAISCSSARQCAGGGGYFDSHPGSPVQSRPALLTLSGRKWTAAAAPAPPGAVIASPPSKVPVTSVACPSATRCFAGGNYRSAGDNLAMLLAWSGKKWTAHRAPLPAGANPNPDALVSGMSCPSVTWCTAVGQYDAAGNQYGLLLRLSRGKWTAAAAPVPAGSEATGTLKAVSCPSVTRCFAGGWENAMQPVMLTWAKSKWSVVTVPLPSGAAANPLAEIDGISCPTVSQCIAVGSYEDSAGAQQGVLLTWRGSNWTARKAPLPSNAGADPWVSLNAVACPASSRCTVGGQYENAASTPLGLLLTWSRQHWTASVAPTLTYNVYAVSCPAVSRCYAVGGGIGRPVLLTGP
jgi:hypothetical protein